jgi:hypothetical protein
LTAKNSTATMMRRLRIEIPPKPMIRSFLPERNYVLLKRRGFAVLAGLETN